VIDPDDLTTLPRRLTLGQIFEAYTSNPAERLRLLRAYEARLTVDADETLDEIRAAYRVAILELRGRTPRPTWAEIGDLLGVTGQRAQQLSEPDKESPRG
jgi:hypothetical protein